MEFKDMYKFSKRAAEELKEILGYIEKHRRRSL